MIELYLEAENDIVDLGSPENDRAIFSSTE